MNLNDAKTVLKMGFNNKICVELKGPPGVGKTALIHQFREELEQELGEPVGLLIEHLSTVEAVDLRGFPHNQKVEGKLVSRYAAPPIFPNKEKFPEGVPKYGILFLDEYMQAGQDVRKAAARLLEERRIGDYSLDEYGHWVVFAASNRSTDYSGVGKPMAFEVNRKLEVHIEPDLDSWVDWAQQNNVHPMLVAYAKAHPAAVFTDAVPNHGKPFCTPRSFVRAGVALADLAGTLGAAGHHGLPLDSPLAVEVVGGLIGEEVAVSLLAFLTMADQLASFEQIVAKPSTAPVPDASRADACYAISEMLAYRTKKEHLAKVFTYLERLPEEFQINTVLGMMKRGDREEAQLIVSSKETAAWMRAHPEILALMASV